MFTRREALTVAASILVAAVASVSARADSVREARVEARFQSFELPCSNPADGLHCLTLAYPDFLVAARESNAAVWKDGTEMPFGDDGAVEADYEDVLNHASLRDQMAMAYPQGWPVAVPPADFDPGRVRHEAFFRKMYGSSEDEVRRHLVGVRWLLGRLKPVLLFSAVNGAANALNEVQSEIGQLPPEIREYAANPAGTFCWRPIQKTGRLSMHSFGAAIDLHLPKGLTRYWQWDGSREPKGCAYPAEVLEDQRLGELVGVFERHGFIWGGKWYHYDTMHFEYRPELLFKNNE